MSIQTRQAIHSLSQSLFNMFQQLNLSDDKLDTIQEKLDNLVNIANDKTKDLVQDVPVTVDKERKERREKDKKGKDKEGKKDKDVVVVEQPTENPQVAKSSKPKRNKRASA